MDVEIAKTLAEMGRKWDRKLGISCGEDYRIRVAPGLVMVHSPIEFPDGAKHPTAGTWQYRFELDRCGTSKIYNVIAVADKNAPPRYGELVPGKTLASPILMRDTLGSLYMKATLEAKVKEKKECSDFAVKDTNLTVMPQVAQRGGSIAITSPYEEAWVVRYCGAETSIPVCFTPKPDGGSSFLTQSCKDKG